MKTSTNQPGSNLACSALTSSLLGALDHRGTILGERYYQAALRLDLQRVTRQGMPSVFSSDLGDSLFFIE